MSSASSLIREALASYVAGRIKPERVVITVAAAFYGTRAGGERRALQPLIDVIDRASPGIVELGSVAGGAGFEIRLAERPFPREHEAALRQAAETVLAASGGGGGGGGRGEARAVAAAAASVPGQPARGVLARLVGAIRRLFSAAA